MRQPSHPTCGFFFRIVLLHPFGWTPVSRCSERKNALADVWSQGDRSAYEPAAPLKANIISQNRLYESEYTMETNHLPVAIIGAGPIGLAAAAHLLRRGETPLVFEAGPSVGAAVLQWGHVRLFSPWRELLDREAAALLVADGWQAPIPQRTQPAGNWWKTTSPHWQTRHGSSRTCSSTRV